MGVLHTIPIKTVSHLFTINISMCRMSHTVTVNKCQLIDVRIIHISIKNISFEIYCFEEF